MAILKNKTFLIVAVIAVVAAGAGLFIANKIKEGNKPVVKHAVDPVRFTEPFVVNLADSDTVAYAKISVAVQLEPMSIEDDAHFKAAPGGGGHGGGSEELTGPQRLAGDPQLRDAVIRTVSTFTSEDLLAEGGKEKLKTRILKAFHTVAEHQKPVKDADGATDHTRPPYHIEEVYLSDFAVQVQ